MSKEDHIELEGSIIEVQGTMFRVKIVDDTSDKDYIVLATLAGKIRQHKIRVVLGDKVVVGVSPYDSTRGIIKYRRSK